jgi:hypothetical protein
VPRGLGIAVPLQSPETDSSCVRLVADAGASSPAVHLPFRVLSKVRYRRTGSTIPPWSLPLTGSTFGVFPRPPWPEDAKSPCHPLVDLALLQSLTRAGPLLSPRVALNNTRCEKPPLLGFPAPPADEVSGSDLRRVCLTRLRCASRLSRPLDALIPSVASPVLFHTGYALGLLVFRGFPSSVAGSASRRVLPLLPFPHRRMDDGRGSRGVRIRRVRSSGPVLPGTRRPFLS